MKTQLILSVALLLPLCSSAEPEIDPRRVIRKGNYELTSVLSRSTVEPGDSIKVYFFFEGFGPVSFAELQGLVPHVLTGIKGLPLKVKDFGFKGIGNQVELAEHPEVRYLTGAFTIHLLEELFMKRGERDPRRWGKAAIWTGTEWTAPITLEFEVDRATPPGEHKLFFRLFYLTAGNVESSNQIVTLRVLSYGERNRYWMAPMLAFLIFLAGLVVRTESPNMKKRIVEAKYFPSWQFLSLAVLIGGALYIILELSKP